MKIFWKNVRDYILHFAAIYLLSCLLLGPALMLLALVVMVVLEAVFGVDTRGDEDNILGGIGTALSLAFVVSFPLSIIGTWWAAPTHKNVQRDIKSLELRMGGRVGAVRKRHKV